MKKDEIQRPDANKNHYLRNLTDIEHNQPATYKRLKQEGQKHLNELQDFVPAFYQNIDLSGLTVYKT
nr:hypothetical protein [Pedobacter sp. ASV19]